MSATERLCTYREYATDLEEFMRPFFNNVAMVLQSTEVSLREVDLTQLNADISTELQQARAFTDSASLHATQTRIGDSLRLAAMAKIQMIDAMRVVGSSIDHLRRQCVQQRLEVFLDNFEPKEVTVDRASSAACSTCDTGAKKYAKIFAACRQCAGVPLCWAHGVEWVFAATDSGRNTRYTCMTCGCADNSIDNVVRFRTSCGA